MTIIRIRHKKNYVSIDNETLRDTNLSLAARGLLAYLLTFKNNWQFSLAHLTKNLNEGKDYIKKVLNELEKFHYLRRKRERRQNGTFGAMIYTIYEKPTTSEETQQETTQKTTQKTKQPAETPLDPSVVGLKKIPSWMKPELVQRE